MRRELLIAGLGLVALLSISWCAARNLYPPQAAPVSEAHPPEQPEPFEPPAPEPVEDEPLLASQPPLRMMNTCHCPTPYGPCMNVAMPVAIAQQFHREHWHDLMDMHCATPAAESYWLRKILERPEGIHYNSRNRLAMADRAAYRRRLADEAAR